MNKVYCNDSEINRYQGFHEPSPEEYLSDGKNVNKLLKDSNSADRWWPNEPENSKSDSRKRWSYGSDVSVEAIENGQSRLCCSPVDEFDSPHSSENEELIINNTDERDDSYKDYLQTSPASSPTFKDIACGDDGKDRSESNDVDTADDELIDYSKRYTTDSSSATVVQGQRNVASAVRRQVPEKKSSKVDPYGDYAETDLDQPTDYSLRYAEEDTDEDEKEDNPQFYCNREQEDTTKTYYTEGTPLETPLNFSASTSMSDLLSLDDGKEGSEASYKRQFSREKHEKLIKLDKPPKDNQVKLKKKYPYEDSKITVLLETAETTDRPTRKAELKKTLTPPQSPAEPNDKEKECNKTVSLNSNENYAQETPLMFSRCSSLDSLNEFDQHSIRDDGSVISEFSLRTSAVVSPSELPDSPTQTVPPSPRRLKQQSFQEPPPRVPIRPIVRKPPAPEHKPSIKLQPVNNVPRRPNPAFSKPNLPLEPRSVFEDDLVFFNSDNLPSKAHSTAASSLSALTIDDEDGVDECDNRDIMNKIAAIRVRTSAAGMHQAPAMQNQPQSYKVVNTGMHPAPLQNQPQSFKTVNIGPVQNKSHSYKVVNTGMHQAPVMQNQPQSHKVVNTGMHQAPLQNQPQSYKAVNTGMHQAPLQNQPQSFKVVNTGPVQSQSQSYKVVNTGVHQGPMQNQLQSYKVVNTGPVQNQSQSYKVVNKHSDCRNNRVFSPPIREEVVHYVHLEQSSTGQLIYVNKESPSKIRHQDSLKDPWRESPRSKINNQQNYLNRSLSRSPVGRRQCNEFIFPAPKSSDTDEISVVDSIRIYCTEDTPTYISPFGSESNLSALSMLSISDENLAYPINSEDDEPPRMFYNEGRAGSRAEAYDSDGSNSNLSEDDFKDYDDGERRIDVSPFDSQVNLDSLALLCIEEEDEEEEEEVATSNETDKSLKDAEDEESEEDHKVLEDCIKSGVRKVTRQQ